MGSSIPFYGTVSQVIDISINSRYKKCVVKPSSCAETVHYVLLLPPACLFLRSLVLLLLELVYSMSSGIEENDRSYSVLSDWEASTIVTTTGEVYRNLIRHRLAVVVCLIFFEYSCWDKFCIWLLCIQSMFLLSTSTILFQELGSLAYWIFLLRPVGGLRF